MLVSIQLLEYAVTAMIIAANINILPRSLASGLLSAIEPPNQFPIQSEVMMIPIRAVHTINDVPKYGATNLEPANSNIIVEAPLKNDTICKRN